MSKKTSIKSTTKKPMEKGRPDPDGPKPTVAIMNTGKHSFWTGKGRVDPGEIDTCDESLAVELVKAGMAEIITQNPDDVGLEVQLMQDETHTSDRQDQPEQVKKSDKIETRAEKKAVKDPGPFDA